MSTVKSEESPSYTVPSYTSRFTDDEHIAKALSIIKQRLTRSEHYKITCPENANHYLVLKLSQLEHEVFSILFLDNRHKLIKYEEMFRGTINSSAVYPREVVKRALQLNAAALILSHNHPSGSPEPSKADERITIRLKDACDLVDIQVLDHIIVGGVETVSLAARGVI